MGMVWPQSRSRAALQKLVNGATIMSLTIDMVTNLMVCGVDTKDYPDFVDCYWESGELKADGRELTEDELIQLGEDYAEHLWEDAMESTR
jgi:hypothetical protein